MESRIGHFFGNGICLARPLTRNTDTHSPGGPIVPAYIQAMAPRARPRAHIGTCSDRTLAALTPGRLGQIVGVLVVMLLDQETGIAAVIETVRALHERGTLTVYGMAALARQGGVGPVLRQPVSRQEALAAPSVGAVVGTLVSVLEGPLNIAMRASGHGLIIAVRDLGDVGLDAGFLEQVSRDLKVGGGAIVAEIDEFSRSRSKTLSSRRRRSSFVTGSPAQ